MMGKASAMPISHAPPRSHVEQVDGTRTSRNRAHEKCQEPREAPG